MRYYTATFVLVLLLKSQEYGSDCVRSIMIELLNDTKSHPDGEPVLYIYSDSRVETPRKY
jgi:hypothetical protein